MQVCTTKFAFNLSRARTIYNFLDKNPIDFVQNRAFFVFQLIIRISQHCVIL